MHQHREDCMRGTVRIAGTRQRRRKPPAHTKLALRLAQQQQTGIGGLGAAIKIYCEFLAVDGWQVERERRIVGHGGWVAGLVSRGALLCNRLLSEWCGSGSRYR